MSKEVASQIATGLIVPAYNAERTLARTVSRIQFQELREAGYAVRLYIVNDGSQDRTGSVISSLAETTRFPMTIIEHEQNRGYGAALKSGFAASLAGGNSFHVVLHADGQYAPEELPVMLTPLRQASADAVIGSKFLKGKVLRQGMPFVRMLGIRLADAFENLAFGLRGMEFHSGYTAWTSNALRCIDFHTLTDGYHFDGEMVLSAVKAGLRVVIVPISTHYGGAASSLAPLPYLREVLRTVVRYWRRGFWFQKSKES